MEERIFEKLLGWLEQQELPADPEQECLSVRVPGVSLTLTQTKDIAVMEDVTGHRSLRTRFVYALRFRLPMEVGREESQQENRRVLDAIAARLRRKALTGELPVFGEDDRLTITYPRLETVREGTGVYSSILTLETTFEQ